MKYGIQYDFDDYGEPPTVRIADNGGRGCCFVEIYEEPTNRTGSFTRNEDDWEPSPLAKRLLAFMNTMAVVDATETAP